MNTFDKPIPPGEPLPHRKVIREWLIPLAERTTAYAIGLMLLDFAVWALLLAGTVMLEATWAKLLCGLAAGFVIGRLFILGHDACHQSLTPHRTLNKWIGRIAFLPSLTPYSLWDVGHNVVHHGYTNLKGFDFVWAPLTQQEYQALRSSCQDTLTWVWCTYTTKPIMAHQKRKGTTTPHNNTVRTDWLKASAAAVITPIQIRPKADTSKLS